MRSKGTFYQLNTPLAMREALAANRAMEAILVLAVMEEIMVPSKAVVTGIENLVIREQTGRLDHLVTRGQSVTLGKLDRHSLRK